jgi:hypothetical protein
MIDEPETGLHPTLQLDFLTRLESYATTGILFASHSYGLCRAAASEIYVIRSSDAGSSIKPIGAQPRLSEFLGELSYASYQEIGFEQVLLVEGVTEIKTIQEFLRKWRKDHKVLLLPLGGSALIDGGRRDELRELQRISPNIRALIDSERAGSGSIEKRRQEFQATCDEIGVPCHVLDRRAMENYLTEAAIKKVFGHKYDALGPYERLQESTVGWAKSDNWRIAREMHKDDLNGTDLGTFFDNL